MDEIENYSESIHEQSNEHAHEILHESQGKERWVMFVALSTAVIAVLAAITGLIAGNHSDEAMFDQMRSSDQWAFYQAKGIKLDMLSSSDKMLIAFGKKPDTADIKKINKEKQDQQAIMTKAKNYQIDSDRNVTEHDILARGITLFQIAIAIGAISIITKRKSLWLVSIGFAAFGVFFLLQGVLL